MEIVLKNHQNKSFRLYWLLLLRLLVFVLLLGIVVFYLKAPEFLLTPFLIYSFFTLGFFLLLLFKSKISSLFLPNLLVGIQILLELYIEAGIVSTTGGVGSQFSILFLITIVSTSLFYHLPGTILVAFLASFFYTGAILTGLADQFIFSPSLILKNLTNLDEAIYYRLFLFYCSSFLVAFISGYLAQRLKKEGEELLSTFRELDRMRMDTDDILRYLRSGLLTVNTSGKIIYFNRAAEEILGYKEKQIKGENFEKIFKERLPEFGETLSLALRSNQMHSRYELYINSLSSRKVPIGMSTSILKDKDGEKRGLIAVFQDLTEAKKLEEKMRLKDRLAAVGELSAGIAHEIRNPLASISGSVEVLKEELSLSEENQKLMELILKESSRLNSIVTEFLQYAKIKETSLTKVELVHLIEEVIEIVKKHPALRTGIFIRKEIDTKPLYVLGEENQIKQLLLNLLVNALEAMEDNGDRILLTNKGLKTIEGFYFNGEEEEEEKAWVPLAIIDNGKGMNEEQKEKAFLPFYSTKKSGTGLGLAIVQRLVNNLNGRIEFKSKLGQGSIFVVYFQKYKVEKEKMYEMI
jgi:two-component system sensor histidine kinase PilS (NtrC family)